MREIRLNSGTLNNPTVLDKRRDDEELLILESGVYVLRNNVIVDYVLGSSLITQMWGSSQVREMWGSSQVKEMWGSSQVKEMRGSSQVNVMRGSSQVNVMRESSQVNVMRESSQVNVMWGSSQVNVMWGSSQVKEMWGSSQVKEMWESSQVKEMWGSSSINQVLGNNLINCFGYNVLRVGQGKPTIQLNDTSVIIPLPKIEGSFDYYGKSYPVKVDNGEAIMYKAVRKIDDKYIADYDNRTEYKIDEELTAFCEPSTENSCNPGLHVSHLKWAVDFGKNWDNMAILECAVNVPSIVVARDCDGKVRTSKLRVVREVPKEEYQQYL